MQSAKIVDVSQVKEENGSKSKEKDKEKEKRQQFLEAAAKRVEHKVWDGILWFSVQKFLKLMIYYEKSEFFTKNSLYKYNIDHIYSLIQSKHIFKQNSAALIKKPVSSLAADFLAKHKSIFRNSTFICCKPNSYMTYLIDKQKIFGVIKMKHVLKTVCHLHLHPLNRVPPPPPRHHLWWRHHQHSRHQRR